MNLTWLPTVFTVNLPPGTTLSPGPLRASAIVVGSATATVR